MKRFGVLLGCASALLAMTLSACGGGNSPSDAPLDPGDDAGASGADTGGFDPGNFDGGNGGGEGGNTFDGGCGGTMMKATARDANILLVLDKSGSMLQKPSGFAQKKWDAVRTSLRDALGPVKNRLSLGLLMYPNDVSGSGNVCAMPSGSAAINVPIESGMASLDKILTAVDGAAPGGATPTARALELAHEYFTVGAGAALKGEKYVILATDGGPNCNAGVSCGADQCTTNIDGSCSSGGNCCDPSTGGSKISCLDHVEVVNKLTALKAAGVKTFVVGIPGTEAYKTYLDSFAEAGGFVNTAGPTKYFSVSAEGGVAGLTGVFSLITGELITSCRIQLETDPPDRSAINVYVDDRVVPQGGPDGWELDLSTSPPSILIKGKTCDEVKSKGAKAILVSYGCPTLK